MFAVVASAGDLAFAIWVGNHYRIKPEKSCWDIIILRQNFLNVSCRNMLMLGENFLGNIIIRLEIIMIHKPSG